MTTGLPITYPVRTEHVEIPVGRDGAGMGGYLARPAAPGAFPGIVVGMELFGIDQRVRDVCERLAGLGFVALAPDFHHRPPGPICRAMTRVAAGASSCCIS
ncbi:MULTISPECIES: dienelactone hydrolase family protein [Kitasatospora]|uniref:Dienelactone hydrolase domain-containing protein n=1 Tax=Kitasatospora cystarginea TaxID=58350 RepID=A0ABP5S0S1_9ACTN